ncbi:energy-coupling factor ABC transporter ATP-binding protein [Oceanobacillus neutriphilus]|uniref:ABC transporter ATP-binding protein n=1 Tax=Oceanobacillus neutriphilus TaxID=531815 RepID=A0ABQ2NV17_9BACI|nr:energy-coupling factor ABC transporter ATP-binding protein [Oceanobacillus neutriphilus]GGP11217.1 ABC transporter ATP-binding protein [Oceanobacillus neutriphilus]
MKIEIKDLIHTYPTGDTALKGISTIIEGTEPVAIIGQNGSGKTTFVKHLNGILQPTGGDILINGESIKDKTTAQWSKQVGYVFQNPDDQLFLNTVKNELEFGPKRINMPAEEVDRNIAYAAELCKLQDSLEVHPFDLRQTEKKFCAIASIIAMDPDVIIFDEPTMGQDVEGSERLANIIDDLRNRGKLCITISHDMKFVVKEFSRIIVLCEGEILLDGDKYEVLSQPEILKKSFVTPPPVTRVSQQAGIQKPIFTVDALVHEIMKTRKKELSS